MSGTCCVVATSIKLSILGSPPDDTYLKETLPVVVIPAIGVVTSPIPESTSVTVPPPLKSIQSTPLPAPVLDKTWPAIPVVSFLSYKSPCILTFPLEALVCTVNVSPVTAFPFPSINGVLGVIASPSTYLPLPICLTYIVPSWASFT